MSRIRCRCPTTYIYIYVYEYTYIFIYVFDASRSHFGSRGIEFTNPFEIGSTLIASRMTDISILPSDSASQVGGGSAVSRVPSPGAEPQSFMPSSSAGQMVAASGLIGSNQFCCNRCKQILAVSCMSASIKNVCAKDVASYKALTDRWVKVRALSTWWKSLNAEQQQEWYRRQQTLPSGSKRNFDEVVYTETAKERSGNEVRERDHFKPWWLFKNDGLSAGVSLQLLEQMWHDAVDNRTADAMHVRGQWCVAQFIGVMKDKVSTQEQEMATKRSKHVASVDQLRELTTGGLKAIEQYGAAYEGARTASSETVGIPETTATPSDHILKPPPAMQFSTAIEREVTTITYIITLM